MPATWKAYGVDANDDGRKDPYNPVDAICAAARYLNAAGGEEDLRTAIFAYNHADWYVDEVLLYASQYGKLPDDLVGSLTGLTEGARFPVAADARYADDISEREAAKRSAPKRGVAGNAADVVSSSPTRRGINIYSQRGRPGRRRQRRRHPRDRRDRRSSATTSSSRTPTATASPTPSSAASPRSTRCPKERAPRCRDFRLVSGETRPQARRSGERDLRRRRTRREGERPPAQAARRGRRRGRDCRADQHRGHARAPLRLPRAPENVGRADLPAARRAPDLAVPRLRELQVLHGRRPAVRQRHDGDAHAPRRARRSSPAPSSAASARRTRWPPT